MICKANSYSYMDILPNVYIISLHINGYINPNVTKTEYLISCFSLAVMAKRCNNASSYYCDMY